MDKNAPNTKKDLNCNLIISNSVNSDLKDTDNLNEISSQEVLVEESSNISKIIEVKLNVQKTTHNKEENLPSQSLTSSSSSSSECSSIKKNTDEFTKELLDDLKVIDDKNNSCSTDINNKLELDKNKNDQNESKTETENDHNEKMIEKIKEPKQSNGQNENMTDSKNSTEEISINKNKKIKEYNLIDDIDYDDDEEIKLFVTDEFDADDSYDEEITLKNKMSITKRKALKEPCWVNGVAIIDVSDSSDEEIVFIENKIDDGNDDFSGVIKGNTKKTEENNDENNRNKTENNKHKMRNSYPDEKSDVIIVDQKMITNDIDKDDEKNVNEKDKVKNVSTTENEAVVLENANDQHMEDISEKPEENNQNIDDEIKESASSSSSALSSSSPSSECSSIKKNTDELTKELLDDLKVIDDKNNSCSTDINNKLELDKNKNDQNESKTETENDHNEKMIEKIKIKEPKQSNGQNENITDSKNSTEEISIDKNKKIKEYNLIDDIDYDDDEEIKLFVTDEFDADDSYDEEITLKNKMSITKRKALKEPCWVNGVAIIEVSDSSDEEIVFIENKIDDGNDDFSGVIKGNTKKTEENNDENNRNKTENNKHKMRNSYPDEKSDVIIVDQKMITNDIDKDDEKNVNEKNKVKNVSGTTENEAVVLDNANDQHMEDISEKPEENNQNIDEIKESASSSSSALSSSSPSSECSSIKKNTDELTKELLDDLKVIDDKNNSCSTDINNKLELDKNKNDQNESKTETENDHNEKMIEKIKEPKQSNGQNENITDSKNSTEKISIDKNKKIKEYNLIDDIDYDDDEEIKLFVTDEFDADDSYDEEITLKNKMSITKRKALKEPCWVNGVAIIDVSDSSDEEIVFIENKIYDGNDDFSGVIKGNTKKTEENNDENNRNKTENNKHKMRNSYPDEKSDVIIVDQKMITNDIDKDDEKNVNEKDKVKNVSGTTENEAVVLDNANDQHMEDISEKPEENNQNIDDEIKESASSSSSALSSSSPSSECSSIKKNTDELTKELLDDLKVIDDKNNSCSTDINNKLELDKNKNDQNESKTETENDHNEKMIEKIKIKEPKQSNGQNENITDSKNSTEKISIDKNKKIKEYNLIDDIDYDDDEEIKLFVTDEFDADDSYDEEITLKNKMSITKRKALKEPYWVNGFVTFDVSDSSDEEIVFIENKIDDGNDDFSGVIKGNTKKTEENNDENNRNKTENNKHKMRNSYPDEKSDVIIVDQKMITNDIDKDDEKNVNEKDKVKNVSGTTENEAVVLDNANDQHMEDISEKPEENNQKIDDEIKESGGKLSEDETKLDATEIAVLDDMKVQHMRDISEKLEENNLKIDDEKELEGKLSLDKDEEKKLTSDNDTNENLKRKNLSPPENCCKKLKRLSVDRSDIVEEYIERKETQTVEGDRKQSSHLDDKCGDVIFANSPSIDKNDYNKINVNEKDNIENVSGTTENEAVVLDNANDQHMEDISEKPEENNQNIDD